MCDPVTAMAVTAGVVSAYSSVQAGENANAVAKYNAREQENQATRTRNKGVEEENIQRRKNAEFLSRQRAQIGANNIDIESGSAADLQVDTELLGEVDALRIRRNFSDQAEQMERQSELTRAQGKDAKRAGYIKAGATLLTTAASAAGGLASSPASVGTGAAQTGAVGASAGGAAQTGLLTGTPVKMSWYNTKSALINPYI